MLLPFRIPKTLLWVFNLLVIFLGLFTAYRVVTLLAFLPQGERISDMWPTFFLGLRFDLRWISLMLTPIILLSLVPSWSPFYSRRNRKVWTWYLAVATFFIIFFFAADFGAFSYNRTRIGASALNFMEDPGISIRMLWESYPLLWMLLGLVITVLLLRAVFGKMHLHVTSRTDGKGIPYSRKWFVFALIFFGFFIHGNVGLRPLKWHEATQFNNSFKTALALNPLQNFFYSLKNRSTSFDEPAARAAFPVMQEVLGIPNSHFSYRREVNPGVRRATPPNVVLVVCESFSMYKSSMSGNPLKTTPYFQALADSGLFFSRCFTPHFSTARGLFATLTGIPDVQLAKFSTRNPQALDQHTIINDFEDYEKFYFLGGDPSFNNFGGLVQNIEDVQMKVEGKFDCQSVNVWGISDKDLFLEANKTFARQQKPFFAIVQTADNHRPFTIPKGDLEHFEKKTATKEELERYGFESEDEYNAFRYADYCFQQFMEAAKKEAYFRNTIFVFVGDHGVSGNAESLYPQVWTEQQMTEEHVPLLFYAPYLIRPEHRPEVVSQIDVLPTVAGLAGIPYTNTTLGRDLLRSKGPHLAFTIMHDEGRIGLITDEFYFRKNLHFQKEELHPLRPGVQYTPRQADSIKRKMSALTSAYYETARWMLVHNKK